MSTTTGKKIGARAGGLVSALAIFGVLGIGGASAADAASSQTPNNGGWDVENAPPELTQAEAESLRESGIVCGLSTAPTWLAGPAIGSASAGFCITADQVQEYYF